MKPRYYKTAKGFQSKAEREWLVTTARSVPHTGLILEVGGEFGASTVCLRTGAPEAALITVDLFPVTLLKEHVENLARADITDTIQIRADSMKLGPLWQIPIDLLFIDGGHEHHVVFQDIRNFSPWVKRGGIMALHDHSGEHPLHASVRRACAEWLNAFGPLWTEIPGADSIRAFRRDR